MTNTTAASKYIPSRPRISIDWNLTFQTSLHKISKVIFFWTMIFFLFLKKKISMNNLCFVFHVLYSKKKFGAIQIFLKIYFIKNVWKVGFQFMLILGLLGMYFDAAVVFVMKSSLFFRLAVTILWRVSAFDYTVHTKRELKRL